MILSPGTTAPDFTLQHSPGETISLSTFKGRPVVLVFYPADWSPVCGDELALFNEVLPEFQRYGAQVVGISVDGVVPQGVREVPQPRVPVARRFRAEGGSVAAVRRLSHGGWHVRAGALRPGWRRRDSLELSQRRRDESGRRWCALCARANVAAGRRGSRSGTMTRLTPSLGPRDHTQGSARAPLQLVEYGDFECPACGAGYPIGKAIQRAVGPSLLFAYRHFPLTRIHSHAEHAAEMAEAAGEHGKFWQMHDLLFENQEALEDEQLARYAKSLGIDSAWAAAALVENRFAPRVREDFASGVRSGVNGTPTFFINGFRYDGGTDTLLDALMEATIDVPLKSGD